MSEQPVRMVPSPTVAMTTGVASTSTERGMTFLLGQIKHMAHRPVAKRCFAASIFPPRDFRLAKKKEVDVVRRQGTVERSPDDIAGTGGLHDARCHDDDEVGFILLIGFA